MKFSGMSRRDQEAYLMFPIITEMKNIGGEGNTKEIKKQVVLNDKNLPEEALKTTKTSNKGNIYHPFDFPFNFAVANLILAGFLKRPKRGYLVLTEKGRNFIGTSQQLTKLVYEISLPKWRERSKSHNINKENGKDEVLDDKLSPEEENHKKISEAINKLSPQKFEILCRRLLTKMHVQVDDKIGTSMSGDGGIDGYGYLRTDDFRTARVAIQAKRWNNNLVSSPEIDKFRGAMDKFRAEYGIFITNSTFTRNAIKAARSGTRVITLIDGDELVNLLIKYHLYVKPITIYELDDFFDED